MIGYAVRQKQLVYLLTRVFKDTQVGLEKRVHSTSRLRTHFVMRMACFCTVSWRSRSIRWWCSDRLFVSIVVVWCVFWLFVSVCVIARVASAIIGLFSIVLCQLFALYILGHVVVSGLRSKYHIQIERSSRNREKIRYYCVSVPQIVP